MPSWSAGSSMWDCDAPAPVSLSGAATASWGHARPATTATGSMTTTAPMPAPCPAASTTRSCAILDDGAVRCWGNGGFGALGYGNTEAIGNDEHPWTAGTVLGVQRIRAAGPWSSAGHWRRRESRLGGRRAPGRAGRRPDRIPLGPQLRGRRRRRAVLGMGGSGALGYANTEDIGDDELPSSVGVVQVFGP